MEFEKRLFIDLSFRSSGFVLCDGVGDVLKVGVVTAPHLDQNFYPNKTQLIHAECQALSDKWRSLKNVDRPSVITYETPFFSQSAMAAKLLGMAEGVLCGVFTHTTPVLPAHTKALIKKNASKKEVCEWINLKYPRLSDFIVKNYSAGMREHIWDALLLREYVGRLHPAMILRDVDPNAGIRLLYLESNSSSSSTGTKRSKGKS